MLKRIAIALAFVAAAVWLWNTSWLAPKPHGAPRLIAHRGVHQTYNREGLTNETCTAERIHPPDGTQPDPVLHQFWQFSSQVEAQQSPQSLHFMPRPLPVFHRECI